MNEEIESKPKKRWGLKILIILIIFFILFFLYIFQVEVNLITIKEQAIIDNELPNSYNGLKIAHFSDIHFGRTIFNKDLKKVKNKINNLNCDIVVFTGDLLDDFINISDNDISELKNNLKDIQAKYRKYAVLGDNDYLNKSLVLEILNDAGFIVLDNSNDLLYIKDKEPLMFIGVSSKLENENDLERAINLDSKANNYFKILLGHEPSISEEIHDYDINIILSGHSLGGLIKLGNFSLLKQKEVDNFYKGHYILDNGTNLYVSPGLGTYKYNVRLGNLPTINFYRIYNN